jgi:glycosyltransferase AglD
MISVIVPVHNQAAMLAQAVAKLDGALGALGTGYEIILCEDGSTDGSRQVAEGLARSKNIVLMSSAQRLGRGRALGNALRSARGSIVIYMDADLATDLRHVPELIRQVESSADIATGSRLLPASAVHGRSALREFFSRGYNLLLRLLFRTSVHDHQCGFKAFRKSSVLPLLSSVKDGGWFWDSELLIRAQARGLRVSEIPVEWADTEASTVRLQSDILRMGLSALRLRLDLWAGR